MWYIINLSEDSIYERTEYDSIYIASYPYILSIISDEWDGERLFDSVYKSGELYVRNWYIYLNNVEEGIQFGITQDDQQRFGL